jgi:hypothetical protein
MEDGVFFESFIPFTLEFQTMLWARVAATLVFMSPHGAYMEGNVCATHDEKRRTSSLTGWHRHSCL